MLYSIFVKHLLNNKNMFNLKSILTIGLLLIIQIVYSQTNSKEELLRINKFVQENLQEVLLKIPFTQIKEYGFNDTDEYIYAKPAKALYFIIYEGRRDVKIWRIPIIVNGEYRALLNISENEEGYEIADFGAKTLAKEIQYTINTYKNFNFEGLFRSYIKGSDFLIAINKNGEKVYIPLASAIKSFGEKGVYLDSVYYENDFKTLLK